MNGERMGKMNRVYSTKWKSMHAKRKQSGSNQSQTAEQTKLDAN